MRQDAIPLTEFPSVPSVVPERPDKPEEACGVFAVMAPGQAVANLTYFGLYALQHRGQESAGIAVFEGTKVRLHKDMGLVSQVFDQDILERLQGSLAIGHNRYSTTGSSKVCNAQPVVLMTRLGPCALAHNGNLVNAAELRASLDHLAGEFTSTTDSELIAFALQQAVDGGLGWNAAIRAAAARCRGAFSLVIGTPDGCFALRDGHGIRPLVFGRLGDPELGQWVVSSESCGLDIIGASFVGSSHQRCRSGIGSPGRKCTSSPGCTSSTKLAPMMSRPQDSLLTTHWPRSASPRRPNTSGRMPCPSRRAKQPSGVPITRLKAPRQRAAAARIAAFHPIPPSTPCCRAKAINSESVVEVNSPARWAREKRSSAAFTRLPLWARAKGPSRVISTTGWALHTLLLPVVE